MSYSTAELDAAWSQYVGLKSADWISLSNPRSAVYNADLAAKINYIYVNKLYGFANRIVAPGHVARKNQFFGQNAAIVNGPTKS
jgi:hypothetical protein